MTVDFGGSPRRALVCFTVEPIGASQREGGEESTTMTSDFKEAVFGTILTAEEGRQRQRACRVKLRVVNV